MKYYLLLIMYDLDTCKLFIFDWNIWYYNSVLKLEKLRKYCKYKSTMNAILKPLGIR